MKLRLLIAGFATLLAAQATAQVYSAGANTVVTGGADIYQTSGYDTLEASETLEDTFKVTEHRNWVTFQFHADKISGNVGGNIVLEGSASKGVPFAPIARIQLLDADTSYSYSVQGNPFAYYRTKFTDTSATHQVRYKTFITVR